jgi:beta-N-acetylhexosaminidase
MQTRKFLFLSTFALNAVIVLGAVCATAAMSGVSRAPSCGTPELERMAGQVIMVGFHGDDENDEGVRAIRAQLHTGTIGGVVLFSENIASRTRVKNLIAFLRNARSTPRPFIAVDQEGGAVQRLNRWNGYQWYSSAKHVGRNPSYAEPEAVERFYGDMATALAETGFNMNLGPVVDLDINPWNPVIGARGRSFGADPDTVTSRAASFIKAHRAVNVATVAKHFPGHGSSRTDSHKRLPDISATWREVELEPYRRLAKEGLLDAVMIGHLYHPRFSDLEKRPASLSVKAAGALRNKNWLAFDGVIVSDDLEMGAVEDKASREALAVMAIKAGSDVVVFSNIDGGDPQLGVKLHSAVVKAVCDGTLSGTRIAQSYDRVMRLKRRLKNKTLAETGTSDTRRSKALPTARSTSTPYNPG